MPCLDDGKRNEMEMDVNSEPEAKWEGVWGRVGSLSHFVGGSADFWEALKHSK